MGVSLYHVVQACLCIFELLLVWPPRHLILGLHISWRSLAPLFSQPLCVICNVSPSICVSWWVRWWCCFHSCTSLAIVSPADGLGFSESSNAAQLLESRVADGQASHQTGPAERVQASIVDSVDCTRPVVPDSAVKSELDSTYVFFDYFVCHMTNTSSELNGNIAWAAQYSSAAAVHSTWLGTPRKDRMNSKLD
jgi:hypothetical protein